VARATRGALPPRRRLVWVAGSCRLSCA